MDRKQEIAALKAKLAVRRDKPAWKQNAQAIEQRIKELEANDGDI